MKVERRTSQGRATVCGSRPAGSAGPAAVTVGSTNISSTIVQLSTSHRPASLRAVTQAVEQAGPAVAQAGPGAAQAGPEAAQAGPEAAPPLARGADR